MKRFSFLQIEESTMEALFKDMIPSEASWYIDNLNLTRDQKIKMFNGMKDHMDWKSKDDRMRRKEMPNWFQSVDK